MLSMTSLLAFTTQHQAPYKAGTQPATSEFNSTCDSSGEPYCIFRFPVYTHFHSILLTTMLDPLNLYVAITFPVMSNIFS
jgi:hypothetical protein